MISETMECQACGSTCPPWTCFCLFCYGKLSSHFKRQLKESPTEYTEEMIDMIKHKTAVELARIGPEQAARRRRFINAKQTHWQDERKLG